MSTNPYAKGEEKMEGVAEGSGVRIKDIVESDPEEGEIIEPRLEYGDADEIASEDEEFVDEDALTDDYLIAKLNEIISDNFHASQEFIRRKKLRQRRANERKLRKEREEDISTKKGPKREMARKSFKGKEKHLEESDDRIIMDLIRD